MATQASKKDHKLAINLANQLRTILKKPKPGKPLLKSPRGRKKTLVLDLDETLIHSVFKPTKMADIVCNVGGTNQIWVFKRPGVDMFL